MGRRRRQGRQAHLVPAQRQAEAGRNGGVRLDHLQVARPARQDQRQGDGGPAAQRDDGRAAAVRRQANDLWRLRESGESIERFPAKWTPVRVKKTRQNINLEPVLIQSEPKKAPGSVASLGRGAWKAGA